MTPTIGHVKCDIDPPVVPACRRKWCDAPKAKDSSLCSYHRDRTHLRTPGGAYRPLAERFWEKVDKRPGRDACWPWTASLSQGYGQINVCGRPRRAPSVAWYLGTGEWVMFPFHHRHLCHNARCVRLSHITIGRMGPPKTTARRKIPPGFGVGMTDDPITRADLAADLEARCDRTPTPPLLVAVAVWILAMVLSVLLWGCVPADRPLSRHQARHLERCIERDLYRLFDYDNEGMNPRVYTRQQILNAVLACVDEVAPPDIGEGRRVEAEP